MVINFQPRSFSSHIPKTKLWFFLIICLLTQFTYESAFRQLEEIISVMVRLKNQRWLLIYGFIDFLYAWYMVKLKKRKRKQNISISKTKQQAPQTNKAGITRTHNLTLSQLSAYLYNAKCLSNTALLLTWFTKPQATNICETIKRMTSH